MQVTQPRGISLGLQRFSRWFKRLCDLALSRTAPRDHRERRSRSVVRGTATGVLARGVAVLTGLLTVPLTVRYLGAEKYGAWMTIATVVVFFSFTDLGLTTSLTNALGRAFGEDNTALARTYIGTSFFALAVLALILAGAGGLLSSVLANVVFPTVAPELRAREIVPALIISIAFFAFSLPLTVTHRVLTAYQETATANLWVMAASLTNLAAVLLVIWGKGGLPMLVLGIGSLGLVTNVACTIWVFGWHKPWLRPTLRDANTAFLRELFSTGWRYFIISVGVMINFQTDNIVISHFLGPSQVTPYSVTFRLFAYSTLLQMLACFSFWPAYTEAFARKDFEWIQGVSRKNVILSLLLAGLILAPLVLFGREIIRLWAGPSAVPPFSFIPWMAVWNLMLAHLYVASIPLEATGNVNRLAKYVSMTAVLNLILSILFVQRFGSVGVIAATVIAYLVCSYPLTLIEARRLLRKLRHDET